MKVTEGAGRVESCGADWRFDMEIENLVRRPRLRQQYSGECRAGLIVEGRTVKRSVVEAG